MILLEDHMILLRGHMILLEDHMILSGDHMTLIEDHMILLGDHMTLLAWYFDKVWISSYSIRMNGFIFSTLFLQLKVSKTG